MGMTEGLSRASYIYQEMVEKQLLERIALGNVGTGYSLGNLETPMLMMLGRSLAGKHTQLLYIPVDVLSYMAVDYDHFGIFIAYKKYARFDLEKPELEVGFVGRKLYVDELYDILFVKTSKAISCFIDKVLDAKIIDAFIMKSSIYFVAIGRKVALIQNANVRFYALFMLAGMTCIFVYLYLKLGL
jgi:NADH-quinone oxidoreductase subunit L